METATIDSAPSPVVETPAPSAAPAAPAVALTGANAGAPLAAPEASPNSAAKPAETQKAPDAAKPKGAEVVTYSLKLPDGSFLDQKAIDRIVVEAKAKNLTPEQAQTRLETESTAVSAYVAEQKASIPAWRETWLEETKNDPELAGGDPKKLAQSLSEASRVIERFGTPALGEMMKEVPFMVNKEFVRLFSKIYKTHMAEDKAVHPRGLSRGNGGNVPFHEALYPDKKPV